MLDSRPGAVFPRTAGNGPVTRACQRACLLTESLVLRGPCLVLTKEWLGSRQGVGGATPKEARGRIVEQGTDAALTHYLRVLRRGLWLVVLTTALATLGAVYASHRQERLYRSSADVLLSNQSLAANLSNVQSSNEDPTRVAQTQADLAQTPPVAERALQLARLTDRSPQQLLASSSVSTASNADILNFSVTDPKPAVAQQLAQAYAVAYTRYRRQLDTASITQALRKVEARVRELKAAGAQGSAGYADLVDKEQQLTSLAVLQG